MPITLTYHPNEGVLLGEDLLLWGSDRQQTRTVINGEFEISDNVIDLGDASQNITLHRDIYENYQGQANFFFLNFDEDEKLSEVEVHHGLIIKVDGVVIDFSMDLEKAAALLERISGDRQRLPDGGYFFKALKLTIANGETMGGEGIQLSYFYCSNDVSHLVNNEI